MTVTIVDVNETKTFSAVTFYFNRVGKKDSFEAINGTIVEYHDSYRLYDDMLHKITMIYKDQVSYVDYHNSFNYESYEQDKQKNLDRMKSAQDWRNKHG